MDSDPIDDEAQRIKLKVSELQEQRHRVLSFGMY